MVPGHINLRPDQLHMECHVRVKGDDACKRLASKLMRNGVDIGSRELSSKGRPYYEYRIQVNSRAKYARVSSIIESTDNVELVVD